VEADPSLLSFNVAFGVLLVDILLSGDNAIVIALVCRSLSKEHRAKALWLGVIGAFLARLVLTSCATLAMNLPLIKIIGGFLLLKISIDLIVENANPELSSQEPQHSSAQDIYSAATTIVLADIVMSLDNVLALSAITQNNWQMLVVGLLLSIPILMFGSLYISKLLDIFPRFLWAGGAILGGVSGSLIVDDPVFDGAFSNATSMAPLVVPFLTAILVVQMSRVIVFNSRQLQLVRKPNSLAHILWGGASTPAVTNQIAQRPIIELQVAEYAFSKPEPVAAAQEPEKTLRASATRIAEPKPGGGDYRVVMALGLFMMLSGGVLYYMLNVYQPSVPNQFITYVCKQPEMTISYMPEANEIRFATNKGVIKTTVIEGRIVWEDYRDAGARLTIPPPVKIVSADASKLVVHGGMFENTPCYPAAR
jgi:YjbE family integral membrane protein